MNTYIATIKVPFGLYTALIVANSWKNAFNLLKFKLDNEDITIYATNEMDIDMYPLKDISSNNKKEEVIYLKGYEE